MTVPLTKSKLESVYRNETDVKVKERLLLILKVKNDGMIPAVLLRNFIEVEHGRQTGWEDIRKKAWMD